MAMKNFLSRIYFLITYFLIRKKIYNTDSHLLHSKMAFKVNDKIIKNLKLKNSFKTPKDLTIISYHSFDYKPLFEKNMDFLGLKYTTIKAETPYFFTKKIEIIYSMVRDKRIKTKYVLVCDSDDVIFTKNPKNIIEVFESFNCDILFCSTDWDFIHGKTNDIIPQNLCIKNQRDWVTTVMGQKKYLNAGAFIFKTDNVCDIFEESVKYISYENSILEIPYGDCDQTIYRWIEPNFYPRIKVDYENQLFTRI